MIPCIRRRRAGAGFLRAGQSSADRAPSRAHSANVLVFLDPELIHAGERLRPFSLERVPAIEIAHETLAAENLPMSLHHLGGKFETDKFKAVLGNEGLDLGNRHPPLLNVK